MPDIEFEYAVICHNGFGLPGIGNTPGRIAKQAAVYAAEYVDIIMLQEVHTWGVLEQLRAKLPKFRYAAYHPGRFGPAGGLVILSKHPYSKLRYVAFSTRRRDFGRGFGKGILACEILGMAHVNFHISSNPRARWYKPNRRLAAQGRQVEILVKFINELGDGPVIVGGDSNLDRTTNLYIRLETGAGLVNPFDDTPTLCGPEGVNWCVDVLAFRGLAGVETETRHLFTGQTARWTQIRQWPKLKGGVVSDHEGLKLKLTRKKVAQAA